MEKPIPVMMNTVLTPLWQGFISAIERAHEGKISLRTKSLIVLAVFLAYAVFLSGFVLHQKRVLLDQFAELRNSYELEERLVELKMTVYHSLVAVFINLDVQDRVEGFARMQAHLKNMRSQHARLRSDFPGRTPDFKTMYAAMETAGRSPTEANLIGLAQRLNLTQERLHDLTEGERRHQNELSEQYRLRSDSVAMMTMILGLAGIALVGATAMLFFTRLSADLRLLGQRALLIARGERTRSFPVTRRDEVGELMKAVNRMAQELDMHERELMIARQKSFHLEKMAAIGSLAFGVAHEIGNPIAAVAGVAEEMHRVQATGECSNPNSGCRPELILSQTRRLAEIMRSISNLAPQSRERGPFDLNELIRNTANLMRFDKRFRDIRLDLALDSQLPALHGDGNQLTQVIMNLLINSADALDGIRDRPRRIVVSSGLADGKVCVTVADNGCGVAPETLKRVFEPFFTTKPVGRGTGLGLSLCQSIVQEAGGTIAMDSTPGVGTEVRLFFPHPVPVTDGTHTTS